MIDQRVIDLYDEYTHAPLDRRVFLERLARLVGGSAAALALVPLLEANAAHAALLPADDPRLDTEWLTVPAGGGELRGYLARPRGAASLPAVIVIHENRGLNPHIEDVTRRLAVEGFLALAPDLLSPVGGTPSEEDRARELIGGLDAAASVSNLRAALAFLATHGSGNGMVGAVGFCWGGGMVGQLAVAEPRLSAGVVYYGRQPAAEEVPKIEAPLLLHYAGLDSRINEGIPAFEEALRAAGKSFQLHRYQGVNHAFNNDTSEARYDRAAAELAWGRTVSFLKQHLVASVPPRAPAPEG